MASFKVCCINYLAIYKKFVQLYVSLNYTSFSTGIVVIVIAVIWYCKCFQKYHINTNTQSGLPKDVNLTSANAVELEANPSYTAIRKEVQQTTDCSVVDKVDMTANPSYTPFLKNDDEEVNPLYSREEVNELTYSSIGDAQNIGYEYI